MEVVTKLSRRFYDLIRLEIFPFKNFTDNFHQQFGYLKKNKKPVKNFGGHFLIRYPRFSRQLQTYNQRCAADTLPPSPLFAEAFGNLLACR